MDKLIDWLDKKILPALITILLVFIPLYPKLPLIGVKHTWVYIRLEDFLVALAVGIWVFLLYKKKINFPKIISWPIFGYWAIGFISTVVALVFIFPHLANVFPNVAIFNFLRRVEYLALLFVAFSTIKKKEDIYKYIVAITIAVVGVILYGFGQKFLGFPAFLTMNEEFAKGIPLYLPPGARITSTFGGHYDLAAFLVMVIALLGSLIFGIRNWLAKAGLLILCLGSLSLLLLTASRVSFAVYLLTVSFMLILQKQKKFIIPVVIISLIMLMQVRGTAERFAKTIRIQPIVFNTQTGQPIAVLEKLPPEISGVKPTPTPFEPLPLGTGFIALPPVSEKPPEATTTAVIRKAVSTSLKLATASSEISTISGSFLIQKAFVYDISFTTRFQGEWPRAWQAFLKNPILGTGFSSFGLATDNDYLRFLGETGVLGLLSFLFIFSTFFIMVKKRVAELDWSVGKSFVLGVTAGIFGLFLNAILIDVFEASKVAFILWLFMGISVGIMALFGKKPINLWLETKKVLLSSQAIAVYLLLLTFFVYAKIFNYYFVGDDFTWLRWAAESKFLDVLGYFTQASGFFYRPLPKLLYFVTYAFFWLKPFGYHLISILIYFSISFLVYLLGQKLLPNKLTAFLAAVLFLFLPLNSESVIWISSYSGMLMTFFVLLSFFCFVLFEEKLCLYRESQKGLYGLAVIFFFALALLSHEAGVVLPFLILWYELVSQRKVSSKLFSALLFLELATYLWIRNLVNAHGLSGDYSYNLLRLPLNVVGNLLGYLGVGYLGISAAPLYDFLRTNLRQVRLLSGIILGVVLAALLLTRRLWQKFFTKELMLFLGFIVISLTPYLGLGNMSERYGLLASVFMTMFLVGILFKFNKPIFVCLVILLLAFYQRDLDKATKSWKKAGETSRRIIYAVKDNYRFFPKDTTIYFVNIPIKNERAWVFPVGLSDAIWFVYRDKTMKIEIDKNVQLALDKAEKTPNSHVFAFENEELKEVTLVTLK